MTEYGKVPVRPKPLVPFGRGKLYADTAAGPPLQKLNSGATLAQLSEDYALFTTAPLLLRGALPVNPVREWMNERGTDDGVWLLVLPSPVVDLGRDALSRAWSTKLWACARQVWDELRYRLGTVAMINRETDTFVRSLCQEIPAPDVVALAHAEVLPSPCPTFALTTFSLDGNRGVLAFEPAKNPPLDLPRLVKMEALPETVSLGRAVLSGATRPYDMASLLSRE